MAIYGYPAFPASNQAYPLYSPGLWQMPQPMAPMSMPTLEASRVSPAGYPLYQFRLNNGYRLVLEQRPIGFVSIKTFINAGSINEKPIHASYLYPKDGFLPGLAHLDEHCHFLTHKNYPQKNSLDAHLNATGTFRNASTEDEQIIHELSVNREALQQVIPMHAEMLFNAVYPEADIEQCKKEVLNEIAQHNASPRNKVTSKVNELLFERPEFQTGGRPEDIRKVTPADLNAFKAHFYTPDKMATVMIGDMDPWQTAQLMNQYFGTIPQGPADTNRAALKRALRPGEIRTATVTDPMLTYSMVTLAFPSIPHRQSKTRAALDLVLNHLTGSPQAVLNLALQHRSPLANNIQAWNTSGKETGKFTILAEVTPGKEQATANALMSELRALQRTPISQQHLDQLKAKACFDFRKNLNEAQFSAMDMGNALFSNTLDDYINYERLINSLTPEDLQQTIQTVLNPTSYVLVYGVPEPKTNKQVSGDRPPAFQGWSPYHTTSLACAGAQRQGHRGG